MLKCVVFDIGGVLVTLGEAEYRRGIFDRLRLSMSYEEYLARYREAVPYLQCGEMAEVDFWKRFAGRDVPETEFDDIFRSLFKPIPEMLSLAEKLRQRKVRTALLSNTQPSHVRLMQEMGFLPSFDPVIFSCEAGCRKPEAEIFRHVLDLCGVSPSEAAFVDDMEENVAAARELGLHGIIHVSPEATAHELFSLLG